MARAAPVGQEHPLHESTLRGFGAKGYWNAATDIFSPSGVFRCFEALKAVVAHAN